MAVSPHLGAPGLVSNPRQSGGLVVRCLVSAWRLVRWGLCASITGVSSSAAASLCLRQLAARACKDPQPPPFTHPAYLADPCMHAIVS